MTSEVKTPPSKTVVAQSYEDAPRQRRDGRFLAAAGAVLAALAFGGYVYHEKTTSLCEVSLDKGAPVVSRGLSGIDKNFIALITPPSSTNGPAMISLLPNSGDMDPQFVLMGPGVVNRTFLFDELRAGPEMVVVVDDKTNFVVDATRDNITGRCVARQ